MSRPMHVWKVRRNGRLAAEQRASTNRGRGMRGSIRRSAMLGPIYLFGALALIVLIAGCEVRPLDPETGRAIIEDDSERFDAESFVDAYWSERILSTIRREAVDLDSILADRQGRNEAQRTRMPAEPIIVHGAGRVVALDDASQARRLLVDLPPVDGQVDVGLQIGPVIRGTALRDAMDFITFDQFVNQLEYAAVSRSLHDRLRDTLLDDLDAEALVGQTISFYGVVTRRGGDTPLLTPTHITAQDP